MFVILKLWTQFTFSASVLLVWAVLDSEFIVSSPSRLWVIGLVWSFKAHSVSPSLPSRDPASSERPTHHSPSMPSQSRDGPTAKPRGSNEERNEARADGMVGARLAISLCRAIKRKLQAGLRQPQWQTTRRFETHITSLFWNELWPVFISSTSIECSILFCLQDIVFLSRFLLW